MLTDVAGVQVGHWSDDVARTGCTVVLLPPNTVASGEVRGGAPATRELDLLLPGRLVEHVDAIVLTGGSAFGLAAADGVMSWLEASGRGYPTPSGPVPIVPALGLYDLGVGDGSVRPGATQGRAACEAASAGTFSVGAVGVGTGCTVGSWRGVDATRPAGLGAATCRSGEVVVSALVAVNAAGDVGGRALVTGSDGDGDGEGNGNGEVDLPDAQTARPFGNTTIGVVATNAQLDKSGCLLVAQSAHDGLARAVFPSHTRADGDAFIAAATGTIDASIDAVRILATAAVEAAIRSVGAPG